MPRIMYEDQRERRGEPVIIVIDGKKLLGTIEWGSDRRGYSVATEPGGARYQVEITQMFKDPGGSRPLWARRFGG